MELNAAAQKIAEQHIAQSLEEMKDPAKFDRWQNGERAKEQAEKIVTEMAAEANQALAQRSKENAG